MNKKIKVTYLSCESLQAIRFPVVLDGNTALLINNLVAWAVDNAPDQVQSLMGLCEHSTEGFEAFMDKLQSKIDPEQWQEPKHE